MSAGLSLGRNLRITSADGAVRSWSCWAFAEEMVSRALKTGLTTVEGCDDWYSGAFLLETVLDLLRPEHIRFESDRESAPASGGDEGDRLQALQAGQMRRHGRGCDARDPGG